jgi:hypothetical protein
MMQQAVMLPRMTSMAAQVALLEAVCQVLSMRLDA